MVGRVVEEVEEEVEEVEKPKPTVVTPSFLSIPEERTFPVEEEEVEKEVEELDDDDDELSSLSSV